MQKIVNIKTLDQAAAGVFYQAYAITREQGDVIANHSTSDLSVLYTTSNLDLAGNAVMAIQVLDANETVLAEQEFDTVLFDNRLSFENSADVDNWLSSYASNTAYSFIIIVATEYLISGEPGDVALIEGSLTYLGQSQASSKKIWVIESQDDENDGGGVEGPGGRPGSGVCQPGQICREEP